MMMVPPGENALAALKLEHTGEHVAQQTEQAAPVIRVSLLRGVHQHRQGGQMPHQQPAADEQGHHGLEHIRQNHHEGQRPAEGPVKIRQARVAAAVGAHVVPQGILRDDHGPVKAAAEVKR